MSATLPYGFTTRSLFPDSAESLSGELFGKKASDIEERWARAVAGDWYIAEFRVRIDPTGSYLEDVWTNVPGELEIDFVMGNGTVVQPVLLQGEIGHFYTDWQADIDAMKQARINQFAKAYGWLPVLSVPARRDDLWRLANQASANQLFREVMPL